MNKIPENLQKALEESQKKLADYEGKHHEYCDVQFNCQCGLQAAESQVQTVEAFIVHWRKTGRNMLGGETDYIQNIGKRVRKNSNKPFKSGHKVGTVKGIVEHPVLHVPCYIFNEDESYVSCHQCRVAEVL